MALSDCTDECGGPTIVGEVNVDINLLQENPDNARMPKVTGEYEGCILDSICKVDLDLWASEEECGDRVVAILGSNHERCEPIAVGLVDLDLRASEEEGGNREEEGGDGEERVSLTRCCIAYLSSLCGLRE